MSSTARGRPKGDPVSWASDAAIVGAPGGLGDGLVPWLEPSAGIKAQGIHPGSPAAPRRQNWLHREHGLRDQYLDLIDVQNWPEYSDAFSLGTGAPNFVRGACALTWHESRRLLVVAGDEAAQSSYDGGYNAVEEFAVAGSNMMDCATLEYNDVDAGNLATIIVYLDTSIKLTMRGTNGNAWDAPTTLTNADAAMASGASNALHGKVIADPYLGCFWIGGRESGAPAVWKITTDDGDFLAQTELVGAAPQDLLACVAKSPTHGIAAPGHGSGSNRLFRWANADSSLTEITPPWGSDVFDLVWDNENGFFVALANDGSDEIEVWRSTSGAAGTWTQISSDPISGKKGVGGSACVRGSVILAACFESAPTPDRYWIAMSTDGGATWELLPSPTVKMSGTGAGFIDRIRVADRRFFALVYGGTGTAKWSASLRTGRR